MNSFVFLWLGLLPLLHAHIANYTIGFENLDYKGDNILLTNTSNKYFEIANSENEQIGTRTSAIEECADLCDALDGVSNLHRCNGFLYKIYKNETINNALKPNCFPRYKINDFGVPTEDTDKVQSFFYRKKIDIIQSPKKSHSSSRASSIHLLLLLFCIAIVLVSNLNLNNQT